MRSMLLSGFAVIAALAAASITPACAQMSGGITITRGIPNSSNGGGVHSNLTCIGQFGGKILGGHNCPLK